MEQYLDSCYLLLTLVDDSLISNEIILDWKIILTNSFSSRSTSIDDEEEDEDCDDADSDEILVAKIHQNYQSHNRMTKSFSGLPSISPSSNNEVVYNGPFIGRARALVDYTPSPYDRDALRFNVSQVFKVI